MAGKIPGQRWPMTDFTETTETVYWLVYSVPSGAVFDTCIPAVVLSGEVSG